MGCECSVFVRVHDPDRAPIQGDRSAGISNDPGTPRIDRTPFELNKDAGPDLDRRAVRVIVVDREAVGAAVGDVDHAGLADRHECYPEPGNEKAYGMSRAYLDDILQQT